MNGTIVIVCLGSIFIGISLIFTLFIALTSDGFDLHPKTLKSVKKNAWILTATGIVCGLLAFLGVASGILYSWSHFFVAVQLVFSAIFALKVERLLRHK